MSTPPCAGRTALFESTHPADHLQARELCLTACDMRETCLAMSDRHSSGTWGGLPHGDLARAMRLLREDQAFTDDDARRAHADFSYRGKRDDRTRAGERVFQRRAKMRKREGAA